MDPLGRHCPNVGPSLRGPRPAWAHCPARAAARSPIDGARRHAAQRGLVAQGAGAVVGAAGPAAIDRSRGLVARVGRPRGGNSCGLVARAGGPAQALSKAQLGRRVLQQLRRGSDLLDHHVDHAGSPSLPWILSSTSRIIILCRDSSGPRTPAARATEQAVPHSRCAAVQQPLSKAPRTRRPPSRSLSPLALSSGGGGAALVESPGLGERLAPAAPAAQKEGILRVEKAQPLTFVSAAAGQQARPCKLL